MRPAVIWSLPQLGDSGGPDLHLLHSTKNDPRHLRRGQLSLATSHWWGSRDLTTTEMQASSLESLIARLPDPASPIPPPRRRAKVRTARQLRAEQTQELIDSYRAGATVYTLGERLGIDRRTVGAILKRNGVVTRVSTGRTPQP